LRPSLHQQALILVQILLS